MLLFSCCGYSGRARFVMNVSLTPELESLVRIKIQSGMYHSASDVIGEGLRLLQERDELCQTKLDSLRREIDEGIKASEEGRARDGKTVMAEMRERFLKLETK